MKGLIIFIILVGVIIIFGFIGWSRVPDMLADHLSKKLGVSVSIDSIALTPSSATVKEVEIGNPKGYSLPKAFSAEEMYIKAPPTEFFRDNMEIEEIEVDDIYLGLEFDTATGPSGNWTQIMQNFQDRAQYERDETNSILIKRLVFTNIRTALLFRDKGGPPKMLPTIPRIVLTNISTEGGFPTDQVMATVLGQMVKQVFVEQNLNNMFESLLKTPNDALDTILKPFKGLFNARMAERVSSKCFHRQGQKFFPRGLLWKAEQTQIEFVQLEELLIGKKIGPIVDRMHLTTPSQKVSSKCFHQQGQKFFPRRLLWKAEQTQIEFVQLEELLIGKKIGPIVDRMHLTTPSEEEELSA